MPLDHVALTVADRERSAAFYAEHFGLTERVHSDEHLLEEVEFDASGPTRVQVEDPDGYRVEIYAY